MGENERKTFYFRERKLELGFHGEILRERDEEEDELNEERERNRVFNSEVQKSLFGQTGWKAEIY